MINSLVRLMIPLVQAFASLPVPMQQVIVAIAAIVAAIGPLLLMVGQLALAWPALTAAVSAAGPAIAAIGTVLAAVSGPVLLLVAAIAALIAVIIRFRHRLEGLKMVGVFLRAVFDDLVRRMRGISQRLANAFQGDTLAERFRHAFEMLGAIVLRQMVKIVNATVDMGRQIMQGMIDGIRSKANALISTARRISNQTSNAIRSAFRIRSPSQVMHKIGQQVSEGFQRGVMDGPGLSVQPPSARRMAGTGAAGGVNITIQNLNVPPGTTRQQVDEIMREIAKNARRRGAVGGR
jgi:hypothetical protein